MKVKELFEQHQSLVDERRKNRRLSNKLIKKNKELKEKEELVKRELVDEIGKQMADGKSLYQICQENFGQVDNRFHNLYIIFTKQMKKDGR
jgi:glucose-6-phosphate-specific signal transduction histidine kinase